MVDVRLVVTMYTLSWPSLLLVGVMVIHPAVAAADLAEPGTLTDAEWERLSARVDLLDKIAFIPSLLPVIMRHQDALGLSPEQITAFREWRKMNYQRMVDIMDEIIERRFDLSRSALKPAVNSADMLQEQRAILELQQELLRIRLSCRDLVTQTFSPDQWTSLAFVLEDYPQFAGLMP